MSEPACGFPYTWYQLGGDGSKTPVFWTCGLLRGHDGAHGQRAPFPDPVNQLRRDTDQALADLASRVAELEERCKYVPAQFPEEQETPRRPVTYEVKIDAKEAVEAVDSYVSGMDLVDRSLARAELLVSLPPCEITDPYALSKLTPKLVRSYLNRGGWQPMDLPSCIAWKTVDGSRVLDVDLFRFEHVAVILGALTDLEFRSQMAVYLDILGMPG